MNVSGFTLSREKYKEIKGYNRQQMEDFLRNFHASAYNDGISAVSKEIAERVDTGIRNTEGIGEKRYHALIENINKELTRDSIQEDTQNESEAL